jgi:thiamine-monophosphate kinase
VLGLTAIGAAGAHVPARSGGRAGDSLWLVGSLGDSAAGLAQLLEDRRAQGALVDVYRRPIPQIEAGRLLAPHASAMMDVSDGLLLDSFRMAEASGCSASIALDSLPLSEAFIEARGDTLEERLFAAGAGDDYALLAAFAEGFDPRALALPAGTVLAQVGALGPGPAAIAVQYEGIAVDLPKRLGFEHHGG